MAKLAILGLLSLVLLVVNVAAQESGDTMIDDDDYGTLYSGSEPEPEVVQDPRWFEPEVRPDPNWRDLEQLCHRYRIGAIVLIFTHELHINCRIRGAG